MNETIFISKNIEGFWKVINPLSNEICPNFPFYCIKDFGSVNNPEIVKPILKKLSIVSKNHEESLDQISVELSIFLIRNGIEANIQLEIPVEDERYVCTVKTWYNGKVFTLNISEPQKTMAFKTKGKKCQ